LGRGDRQILPFRFAPLPGSNPSSSTRLPLAELLAAAIVGSEGFEPPIFRLRTHLGLLVDHDATMTERAIHVRKGRKDFLASKRDSDKDSTVRCYESITRDFVEYLEKMTLSALTLSMASLFPNGKLNGLKKTTYSPRRSTTSSITEAVQVDIVASHHRDRFAQIQHLRTISAKHHCRYGFRQ